mgnify:CR=1 FL=1
MSLRSPAPLQPGTERRSSGKHALRQRLNYTGLQPQSCAARFDLPPCSPHAPTFSCANSTATFSLLCFPVHTSQAKSHPTTLKPPLPTSTTVDKPAACTLMQVCADLESQKAHMIENLLLTREWHHVSALAPGPSPHSVCMPADLAGVCGVPIPLFPYLPVCCTYTYGPRLPRMRMPPHVFFLSSRPLALTTNHRLPTRAPGYLLSSLSTNLLPHTHPGACPPTTHPFLPYALVNQAHT